MNDLAAGPPISLSAVSVLYGPRPVEALAEAIRMAAAGDSRADITKATGHVPGLLDVALTIPAGALFVVMGLSGSGKSTLLRTINRLVTPAAGRVAVGQTDVTALDDEGLRRFRRASTAMVFQNFGLMPHWNAVDNVAFPLRLQGHADAKARTLARPWLERLGLATAADAAVDTLSSGMKQRVGLARALITGAPVLLMDEPFGALDPITRQAMQDELKRLQQDLRKTVVLITHDPREAFRLADVIAVVRDARMVQIGTPAVLKTQPADVHVAQLLAAAEL